MWNASHLAVRLCALRHWKRVSIPPTTQSLRHPLTRAIHFAPRLFFMFFVSAPLAPLYFSTEPKYNLGQYRVIGSGGKKWVGVLNN